MEKKKMMKRIYLDNGIKAEFDGLEIGSSILEPITVKIRLKKSDSFHNYQIWKTVVCFYDARTKKVWMDEKSESCKLVEKYELTDSLCAFVKEQMDAVFSSQSESVKHLVEIMCMAEDVVLGEYAMFYKYPQYGLSYTVGHYVLEIPVRALQMDEREEKEFKRLLSNPVMDTKLNRWLYLIASDDPSYMNKIFMVNREPGKRCGTKVVRECQAKLLAALKEAEEWMSILDDYWKSM